MFRFFALIAVAALVCPAAEEAAVWTPGLSMRILQVADVIPSPDGKLAVWTQRRAVMEEEKSEFVTQIYLGRTDGSRPVQLTRGDKGAGSPRFSPDAKHVFFLSERNGKNNLYRIPIEGGEAERLTDWKGRIGSYRLSPDGKRVALAAAEEDKDEEKRKKSKTDLKIVDADPKNLRLYLAELGGDVPLKLRSTGKASGHLGSFDWSGDSAHIAYELLPTSGADDLRASDLYELNVESGESRAVAATRATESSPVYSPDGRHIVFLRSLDSQANAARGKRLVLYTRATGAVRELAATPDEAPQIEGWTPDSKRILYSEPKGVRAGLSAMPLDGPPELLFLPLRGTFRGATLNLGGTHAGIALETPDTPVEAYILPAKGGEPKRVSAANIDVPRPPLGRTETVRWKGADGLEIEGLLTLPVNYRPGEKAPFILNIHGGPAGVYGETFIGAPGQYPLAAFAAKGYAVLRANPRGSSGYGGEFRRRVIGDWGGLDYRDLMAGVDYAIAKGVADPQRLAVMGWSYGGYMTAWIVSQTNRFKAAAVGAGITNTISMYGTQDVPSLFEDYFGGALPWEKPDVYLKSSPLNFIARATTPTLILHGENDARVPVTQGYEFYRALKRRNVPVKMVVYPRMPHGPTEPKFTLDIMNQHLEWVERHVR